MRDAGARIGLSPQPSYAIPLSWHRAKTCEKPCCSVSAGLILYDEQVLMRGIADQVATRLARHGASDFNVKNLGMICWAYGKLKVRRCLNIDHHCCDSAGQARACCLVSATAVSEVAR